MNEFSDVKVLLLEGFARQIMPLIQALHDLGCHVTTYNSSKLDMGYSSRYPNRKIVALWDRTDAQKSLNALKEVLQKDKYDIVIPLTDFSATILAQNKEELSQYAAISVNDWDIFQLASDKQKTMTACMDNDIPCPFTLRDVETVEDVIDSGIKYPFVLKPRVGYGSIGFHCIKDQSQLLKVFSDSVQSYGKMLVQEYIPQTDLQYKAEVFIDKEGNIKSACIFDKTRWYPIDGGSTCCSATVYRPDIVETSTKLLKTIGWKGYGDVDLILDPRDGVAKVMEINPRITASVKVCMTAGVNFARQIVEYETNREVTEYMNYREDVRLRYMHTDLLWFIDSPNRFKTKPSWFSFKRTTDQIFSISDPLPWFTYSIQAVMKLGPELQKRKRD